MGLSNELSTLSDIKSTKFSSCFPDVSGTGGTGDLSGVTGIVAGVSDAVAGAVGGLTGALGGVGGATTG